MRKSPAAGLWASEIFFAAATWYRFFWLARCEEALAAEPEPDFFRFQMCAIPDWLQVVTGLAALVLLAAIPYFGTKIFNGWSAAGRFEKLAGAVALAAALPAVVFALFMLRSFTLWVTRVIF